jgi:YD repeat-containing protein
MSSIIPERAAKRKEIASYGASGLKVRVLDEIFRGKRYVRVQWGNPRQTQSWDHSRENIITAKRVAQSIAEGRIMPAGRKAFTLSQGWAAYAAGHLPNKRARTRTIYTSRWLAFASTQAADRLCEELDGTHFDTFVNRCRAEGAGEYEIQQILDGVKRVLRWLVERRLIKHSYVETYRFTSVGIKDLNSDQEYTYDEAQRLLAQFDRNSKRQWRPWALINLLAHQGVRETAAVHLKWDCVDLEAGTIIWDGRYDKTRQTWQQPIREETRKSLELALAMRERCRYKGPWVFFSECAQGERRKGHKGLRDAERTAETGTYRIQSLAYQLEQAEKRAGIAHVEGRGLHGFRRMVAGDMYEILGNAELAMEFINDTSAMTKTYVLRRMPRIMKSAEAADAALRLRRAVTHAEADRRTA